MVGIGERRTVLMTYAWLAAIGALLWLVAVAWPS